MLHMISGSHNPDQIQKACGFGREHRSFDKNVRIHSTPIVNIRTGSYTMLLSLFVRLQRCCEGIPRSDIVRRLSFEDVIDQEHAEFTISSKPELFRQFCFPLLNTPMHLFFFCIFIAWLCHTPSQWAFQTVSLIGQI